MEVWERQRERKRWVEERTQARRKRGRGCGLEREEFGETRGEERETSDASSSRETDDELARDRGVRS